MNRPLGPWLKKLRALLGWTQKQMAVAVFQSRESVNAVENGTNHWFRPDKIAHLVMFCKYADEIELRRAVDHDEFPDLPAIRERAKMMANTRGDVADPPFQQGDKESAAAPSLNNLSPPELEKHVLGIMAEARRKNLNLKSVTALEKAAQKANRKRQRDEEKK